MALPVAGQETLTTKDPHIHKFQAVGLWIRRNNRRIEIYQM
jgi:hypothetical protein